VEFRAHVTITDEDNYQNYHRQHDLRVGRKNVMNIGMSGLYMEAHVGQNDVGLKYPSELEAKCPIAAL
jgi:hypothetical protein